MNAFAAAVAFVLQQEGGFANHPADRGGVTKFGITHLTLATWRNVPSVSVDTVRALRITEAVAIYEARYWKDGSCHLMRGKDALALCHFDCAVNTGVGRAVKLLQLALVNVKPDGVFGPRTADAVATCDEVPTVERYLRNRLQFYAALAKDRPTQKVFLRGWQARCRHVAAELGVTLHEDWA